MSIHFWKILKGVRPFFSKKSRETEDFGPIMKGEAMGRKTYDELDFTDDFLFCRILMENEDLCIELVEMITGRKIRSVLHPQDQKAIQLTRDGMGIRLDVYFEDEDNVIYDIEMQTEKKEDIPKRSRYYQGLIDLNILSKGEKYNKLKLPTPNVEFVP